MQIAYQEALGETEYQFVGEGFRQYALESGLDYPRIPFHFVAKEGDQVVGVLEGKTAYQAAHIGTLIVSREYRHAHIGSKLLAAAEEYLRGQGYHMVTLDTYQFQAPVFYQKCGYEIEFVRENRENPSLNRYYLVKHI